MEPEGIVDELEVRPTRALLNRKSVVKVKTENEEGDTKPVVPKMERKQSNTRVPCCFCKKTFTKTGLTRHKRHCKKYKNSKKLKKGRRQKQFQTLQCDKCDAKFKFKKAFMLHKTNEHSEAPDSLPCEHCDVRCPNQEVLDNHTDKVHTKMIYGCQFCDKTFIRHYHVVRHMMQSGCGGFKSSELKCEICNTKFTRKDNLLVHLRLHLKMKQFRCKKCSGFSTSKFSRLMTHDRERHLEHSTLECHHCGKVTGSRGAMAKHLEIHGPKKFACEMCGYSSHTFEVMRRHVMRHTTEKPFKCDVCGKSFIQSGQLKNHLQQHLQRECAVCHETFARNRDLIVHARTHNGQERLVCPVGGCSAKEFAFEKSRRDHIDTVHNSENEYKCSVCSKVFATEMFLRRHIVTHELHRPRRCMYCATPRAYIRGDMLLRHVRLKHPPVFMEHLAHVRQVLGVEAGTYERVKKAEMDSVLQLLDAIADRILEQGSEAGGVVLYGGMQPVETKPKPEPKKEVSKPTVLSEKDLSTSLELLMTRLIDANTLEGFGWPGESVDVVLERVIEQCDQKPAAARWSRVQRLRENAKHLFLHVTDDKEIARMLSTHTIDQVVMHILEVSEPDAADVGEDNSAGKA